MTAQQLKNSILQMAVQGRLVEQNPHDEPACELIKRIREEKEERQLSSKKSLKKQESTIYKKDNSYYEKAGSIEKCIDEEIPFDIPESWEWVRLGDISILNPRNIADNELEAGFMPMPLLFDGYQSKHIFEIKKWASIKSGFTHFSNGDIVIAKITPCFQNRKSAIITNLPNNIGSGTTELYVVRSFRELNPKYLLWLFKTPYFIENGKKNFTGTAGQQRIGKSYIEQLFVPLPPLAEQERIVAKIEEILPHINEYDEAHKEIEKLNKDFPKQIKNSILQWAVQGRLVEQNPHDEPACELIKRIREEKEERQLSSKKSSKKQESTIYKKDNSYYEKAGSIEKCIDEEIPFDIPESWEWVRLEDVGIYKKGPFGSSLTKNIFVPKSDNTIKVYEQKNAIKKDHTLGDYYISRKYYEEKMQGFSVAPNDIIVSCAGTIGETYILPHNIEIGIINQALMKMTIYAPINIDFFLMYFDYVLKKIAQGNSKGSAIKNIPPFDIFKQLLLPLPPLAEQERIVEKIESLLEQVKQLQNQ